MDVLINIIVTIAIIFFVLRRVQEVARKGGDITGPPPPSPMFPEEDEEMLPRPGRERRAGIPPRGIEAVDEEEMISDESRRGRIQRAQERLREQDRGMEERRKDLDRQRRLAEERFLAHKASEFRAPVPAASVRRAPAGPERRVAGGMPERVIPEFGRSAVLRGIIMSEVLGPPVSLRSDDPF